MKKLFRGVIGLVLALAFFIPLIKVNALEESRITITIDGAGTFNVTADTSATFSENTTITVSKGTEVTLTAIPGTGSRFKHWIDAINHKMKSGIETYTFTASEDVYELEVAFTNKKNVSIYSTEGGKVKAEYSDDIPREYTSITGVNYNAGDEIKVYAKADDGYEFIGWYQYNDAFSSNPDYKLYKGEILSKNTEYTYKPDETVLTGFSTPITDIVAVFEKSAEPKKEYIVKNDEAEISFSTEEGHTYELNFFNVLSLSLEELNKATDKNMTEEEYNKIIESIKDVTKEYGNLIGLYAIEVNDPTGAYTGAVNVKVKLTEEMKKYNTFKFIYIDDSNEIKIGEIADFKIEGDYLVGTLPHLSAYALVGRNVTNPENPTNPNTIDGLKPYILVLGLSLVGILSGVMFVNNKKSY